jgi:methylglutaconyl-CoA hydratase
MEQGWVKFQIEGGVGTLEFGHPQSNSLPSSVLQSLADQITAADQEGAVRVIVLKSSGEKTFCAGASFDELCNIQNEEEGLRFFSGFAKVINACRTSEKLIIGRVQGKAVGGGVGLAAATDYCFASTKADVKLSELAVGIGPFVVGPAVERKIGLSAMSELAINATEWRSADWAKTKGLYTEIYETMEEMDNAVDTLAHRLAASNPEAMKALKQIFWKGTDHWDQLLLERAGISGNLVLSAFTRNAIASFKAK